MGRGTCELLEVFFVVGEDVLVAGFDFFLELFDLLFGFSKLRIVGDVLIDIVWLLHFSCVLRWPLWFRHPILLEIGLVKLLLGLRNQRLQTLRHEWGFFLRIPILRLLLLEEPLLVESP